VLEGILSRKEDVPQRLKPQLFAGITDGLKAVPFNCLVGALCFSRGKQRFSVAAKNSILIVRFSAGLE
jgi:hypothetical protein